MQQQIHDKNTRTISTSHYSLKLLSDGSRLEAFAPRAIIAAIEKSVAPTQELPLMIFAVAVAVLVAASAVVAKTPDWFNNSVAAAAAAATAAAAVVGVDFEDADAGGGTCCVTLAAK